MVLRMDFIFHRRKKGQKGKCAELPTLHESTTEEQLVIKSGYISLKDRISNLSKSAPTNKTDATPRDRPGPGRHNAPQYATLQELFASKSGNFHNSSAQVSSMSSATNRRPKIPIMRLTKEDWNVKCWEERLNGTRRGRQVPPSSSFAKHRDLGGGIGVGGDGIHAQRRPEPLQVKVFQGRVEDVAGKLEKMREGAPLDEELYRISTNKVKAKGRSHEWTDLLKQELARGTHNSKHLREEIMSKTATSAPSGLPEELRCVTRSGEPASSRRAVGVRSPLGRPIGRILDADSSGSSSGSDDEAGADDASSDGLGRFQ